MYKFHTSMVSDENNTSCVVLMFMIDFFVRLCDSHIETCPNQFIKRNIMYVFVSIRFLPRIALFNG